MDIRVNVGDDGECLAIYIILRGSKNISWITLNIKNDT